MPQQPFDPDDPSAAASIDLARIASFPLGCLTVAPATLRMAGAGWSQRLEPRVMQLLVVLARAAPAVVSRADLNRLVWGGRIVGDDAINRAVQTLRRIAADAPPPVPFAIETIPRVGYRLMPGEPAAPLPVGRDGSGVQAGPPAPEAAAAPVSNAPVSRGSSGPSRLRRGPVWAVIVLAGVAALLALRGWGTDGSSAATWRVAGSATFDELPLGAGDVALSPDGKRLAYRGRDARGRGRIYVRSAGNDGPGLPIGPVDGDARHPAWSPDSAALAFVASGTDRPCRLYVLRRGRADRVGTCEAARDPHLSWSADGHALLFGDAPGWNAVPRVTSVDVTDGRRMVLSSPPGDSMGDDLPTPLGTGLAFRRQFAFGDEGWVTRDPGTGRERSLWRRRGVIDTVAAPLPDGTLAIAWTAAGASTLDFVYPDGRIRSQPILPGPVAALSQAGTRLLLEIDRSETALTRAGGGTAPGATLMTVRGKVRGPMLLPDGRIRVPVVAAGAARMWERDVAGSLRPWGTFVAGLIAGPALSPDGRFTAALAIETAGREVVLFDASGTPLYKWHPQTRSLNPPAWSGDGRRLIVPVLDGAGWRLYELDPFKGAPPRDIGHPGFATVYGYSGALYAVRAGETIGIRELWRLDGQVRRLPIDLTLFDIMNWRPVGNAVWLPDRSDPDYPRLVQRDMNEGHILRRLAAPGLAGPGSGLDADATGPIYARVVRDEPENIVLTLDRDRTSLR